MKKPKKSALQLAAAMKRGRRTKGEAEEGHGQHRRAGSVVGLHLRRATGHQRPRALALT